jgi:membrane protein required for colicin V production
MNFLDIIILILLVLSAISGFQKGFIVSLTSLVALILGIYVAMYFSDFMTEFLQQTFSIYTKYLSLIAFALTFMLVVVLVNVVGKIAEKFVDILLLGIFDKIAGAVFGVLKGVFILSILIMILNYFHLSDKWIKKEAREKSKLYMTVESVVPYFYQHLDFLRELNLKLMEDEDKGTI